MLPYGSIAAEQWLTDVLTRTFNGQPVLPALAALVGGSVINADVLPEDEELPALFFYRTTAMDVTPIGNQAAVSAEDLRYVVELMTEGESYGPLMDAAVEVHDAIHRQRGQVLGCQITCERLGELPGTNRFVDDGRHYTKLGGIYQVVVTNAGG